EQEATDTMQALKQSRKTSRRQPGTEGSNERVDRLDWNNLEGDHYLFDLSKPLPLQGLPGHQTVVVDYFFNNDLEYLKTSDLEELKKHTTDLIQKYYLQQISQVPKIQTSIVDLEQESEKSPSEILKIKKEQAEKQKMPKFTIKFIDKATLKEYDQKRESMIMMMMKILQLDQTRVSRPKGEELKSLSLLRNHPPPRKPQKVKLHLNALKLVSLLQQRNRSKNIAEVIMDDVGEDVVRHDDQPQDTSKPKTTKTHNPEWFKQPPMPPTLDPEWNKRQVVLDPWFNQILSATQDPLTFNDLMATLIDFFKYVFNRLKMITLLKISCKLDCKNPKGNHYPFDMSKPLHMQGHPGHLTIATDYFFNNDLEYLKSSNLERTYTTSITKTKAARYENEGIEDKGEGRKLWYKSQLNKFSKHNVYSAKKNLGVKSVSVKKLHVYGHLEEIVVKRADRQYYKFKEGNFVDLHLNDIKDMLLLAV
nr:hypothetical protein [Tanacetum cinerariifolium]